MVIKEKKRLNLKIRDCYKKNADPNSTNFGVGSDFQRMMNIKNKIGLFYT